MIAVRYLACGHAATGSGSHGTGRKSGWRKSRSGPAFLGTLSPARDGYLLGFCLRFSAGERNHGTAAGLFLRSQVLTDRVQVEVELACVGLASCADLFDDLVAIHIIPPPTTPRACRLRRTYS